MAEPRPELDSSVPALIVKVSPHVYDHGSLGAARSLGRAGVPVYAITEDRNTPIARSRYVRGRFPWWIGDVVAESFVTRMLEIGTTIGRPAVPITTDDVAAVLLAEHAARLSEHFILPAWDPVTVHALSSKAGMYELCRKHGVPTPRTVLPTSREELFALATDLRFPIVAKNAEPGRAGGVAPLRTTTVVMDRAGLERILRDVPDPTGVLLQEYIPHEQSEDWFVALYSDAEARPLVQFSGRKVRAWPVRSGMTADGAAEPNPELNRMAGAFVRAVGWRGPASLDWRLDRRTGEYNLVDFNVRLGAQFRFGETLAGIDVVRAYHMDMTGRRVPAAAQDFSRRLRVGNLFLLNAIDQRLEHLVAPEIPPRRQRTVRAWSAADDPLPTAVMLTRGTAALADGMLRRARTRRRNHS